MVGAVCREVNCGGAVLYEEKKGSFPGTTTVVVLLKERRGDEVGP